MSFVITRLCRDHVDTSCVEVCPVSCIYEYTGDDREKFPNQLYIDPEECIDCGACEPACPWQAIYPSEDDVPEPFKEDVTLNRALLEAKDSFKVAETEEKPEPSPEEIEENKKKWGLEV